MFAPRLSRILLLSALLAPSCAKKHAPTIVCPRAEPAFRLQVSAIAAAVPDGTRIEVTGYQGNQSETFVAGEPGRHVDVCCQFGPRVTGALPHVVCPTGSTTSSVGTVRAHLDEDGSVVLDGSAPVDASVRFEGGAGGERDGGTRDSGAPPPPDGGNPDRALQCELWTNGSATLHVAAPHFAPVTEDLVSKLRDDGCGVRTVDTELVLVHVDGG
ncbi:MAG TPA: hypothetical protein VHE30_22090 [Polyangiaceae bacterium]|nr:hypothetical protein [Polyangiaceae bacterium]